MKTIILDGIEYELVPVVKDALKPTESIYDDWRLPTIEELMTLIDYSKYKPASKLKDTLSVDYWSFTTPADYLSVDEAWFVDFNSRDTGYYLMSSIFYVRCVRDGYNGLEWSETSKVLMTWEEAIEYATSLKAPAYYKEHNDNLQ